MCLLHSLPSAVSAFPLSRKAAVTTERERAAAAEAAVAIARSDTETASSRFGSAETAARNAQAECAAAVARADELATTVALNEKMLDDQNEALRGMRRAGTRAADAVRERDTLDDECASLRVELADAEDRLAAQVWRNVRLRNEASCHLPASG